MNVGRLHVLTDGALFACAVAGRADVVQYREKRSLATSERVSRAAKMLALARDGGTRLIVNDRVDVAAAVLADGVHLGARDLALDDARRILGPGAIVGSTVNRFSATLEADHREADYLGVGPVFGTRSKSRPAPTLGVDQLARIARSVAVPVIAIGNLTPDRVAEVLDAGAYGVAVCSDVAEDRSPDERVACFREAIDRWCRNHAQAYGASRAS